MDKISRGVATAALTLQPVMLQSLVRSGLVTLDDALDIVDRSLEAAANVPSARAAGKVVEVTMECLTGVREGPANMPTSR